MEIEDILSPIGEACFIGLMVIGVAVENWGVGILGFIGFIASKIVYNLSF
jgi:hypothetical protein